MIRRLSPNVQFALLGLALMHVSHLIVGPSFFVVPGVVMALALAGLGRTPIP